MVFINGAVVNLRPESMTTAERTAVSPIADGRFVYDSDLDKMFYGQNGSWVEIVDTAGQTTALSNLKAEITSELSWKDDVHAAAATNVDLATARAGDSVGGVTTVDGESYLLPLQTASAENGVYVFHTSIAPTRRDDMNASADVNQAVLAVREGTYAGKTYRQTEVDPVIDTDDILFVEFSTSLDGTIYTVTPASIAGNATYNIDHNLNTSTPTVTFYLSDGTIALGDFVVSTANRVVFTNGESTTLTSPTFKVAKY